MCRSRVVRCLNLVCVFKATRKLMVLFFWEGDEYALSFITLEAVSGS